MSSFELRKTRDGEETRGVICTFEREIGDLLKLACDSGMPWLERQGEEGGCRVPPEGTTHLRHSVRAAPG